MSFVSGLLRPVSDIEISGMMPEAALNAAAAAGIELEDIRFKEQFVLAARCPQRDIKKLRELCRRTMCDVRITRSSGERSLIKRRLSLLTALAAMLTVLCASGLFVWEVEVCGNESVSRGEILRALSEAGLDVGTFRPLADTDIIRSRALPKLPELSWLGVQLSGSRAEVHVIERGEVPEIFDRNTPCDIQAAKNGVITEMKIYNGTAAAAVGDAVREGAILVSGAGEHASAEVTAYTWYELTARAGDEVLCKRPNGAAHDRFALILGKNRINFYLNGRNNIDECDKIIYEYKIGIEGVFCLPITLVRERLVPYRLECAENDDFEILQSALMESLENECRGEIQSCAWSYSRHDGVISVTLRARCLENIASERKSQ